MKDLSNNDKQHKTIPTAQDLIGYLQDSISEREKREMEEMISDDQLVGDAVEGLLSMKSEQDIQMINRSLSNMIDDKLSKKRRKKRIIKPIGFPLWLVLLITVTLLAILGGYVLVHLLQK